MNNGQGNVFLGYLAGYYESGSNKLYITNSPHSSPLIYGEFDTQKVKINGSLTATGAITAFGSDVAEPFAIFGAVIKPGLVMVIDPQQPGQLRIADRGYDRTVAGVISGAGGIQPGLLLQQPGTLADGDQPVAMHGRVYCWADATYGVIQPGDLLTISNTPGHAMKVTDYAQAQGAILGKAMTALEQGQGLVLVLVTLQ